jgi:hypothetical protein
MEGMTPFVQHGDNRDPSDDHYLVSRRNVMAAAGAFAIQIGKAERRSLVVDAAKLVMQTLKLPLSLLVAASPRARTCKSSNSRNSCRAKANRRMEGFGD